MSQPEPDSLVKEQQQADEVAARMSLARLHLASAAVHPDAIAKLAEKLARKYTCLPVKLEGRALVVAFANPADFQAVRDIEFASGSTVRPVVATATEILDAIARYYAPNEALRDVVGHLPPPEDFRVLSYDSAADTDGSDVDSDAVPVIKLCNVMIYDAVRSKASDVHIEPGLNDVQVRMRVDGARRERAWAG